MSKRIVRGICRICGKEGKLTFEHIPPGATYNKQSVRLVKLMDLIKAEHDENALPWELDRAPSELSQKGRGEYCLCESCNNNTGSWYGAHYKRFIDAFMYVYMGIRNDNVSNVSLELYEMRPLPIIKQIFAMFCDINPQLTTNDPSVRDFLLNKDSRNIDRSKYRIFMYLYKGGIEKTAGLTAKIFVGKGSHYVLLSEIATIPVGFILYEDMPENYKPNLTEITYFLDYEYSSVAPITMTLNAYEVNSWLPEDFRTKQEILATIEKNKERANGKDAT